MKRDPIFAAEQALRGDLSGWLHDHTEDDGDCMIWQFGCCNKGRTPACHLPRALPSRPNHVRKLSSVTRIVYEEFHHAAIKKGRAVWRACGNPRCVAPTHLRCDTYKVMAKKMGALGFLKADLIGAARRRDVMLRKSKLTWDDVQEIRRIMDQIPALPNFSKAGETDQIGRSEMQQRLAEKYGVGIRAIQGVVRGKSWKVPPANHGPFAQLLRLAA